MRGWSPLFQAGWIAAGLLGGSAVLLLAARHRRGSWRLAAGGIGMALLTVAGLGLRDPLASMTQYTFALMVVGQVVPPFLLLATTAAPGTAAPVRLAPWWRDPGVAAALFGGLAVATGLPSILDRSLANALFSAPLGLLDLLAGLLFWAQLMPGSRVIRHDPLAGAYALLGSLPMTVVAVVWMTAPRVLYAPYLDVLCRWDLTPLEDQHWAGFVMLVAGLPLQVVGAWLLVAAQGSPSSGASRNVMPGKMQPPSPPRRSGEG
ncbi:cytochrome c oxidase assembly protein [Gluconacetobacter sacchari]|uniref:Cytochrome c oxidase caa3-type, assembly factor CtaG-like protein n=2 Tax=Gluconacetobacter sacchari TaxID=92759 RepID=A0A7W4I9D5_9PROT|nr:cytochrome c oxidase assembly protein [Gluconacetobacter sacchari]MBB2158687.1 cytochrome c oxidase caa3-type, assembly factor CtaG-like protein [Gluconacetobacter sacchari]GBQ19003.1 putative membrane protein [Gluconacetobacter sacchari DSM 12717]